MAQNGSVNWAKVPCPSLVPWVPFPATVVVYPIWVLEIINLLIIYLIVILLEQTNYLFIWGIKVKPDWFIFLMKLYSSAIIKFLEKESK